MWWTGGACCPPAGWAQSRLSPCGSLRPLRRWCFRERASASVCFVFFFQAEDGIRDLTVTGVQTCALPIWDALPALARLARTRVHDQHRGRADDEPDGEDEESGHPIDGRSPVHDAALGGWEIGRASCRERV